MSIQHKKTEKILTFFEEISKIPRCSKNEEKIGEWLVTWADENKFNSKKDQAGNILILVPGSVGYETSPTVIIQGHMDMVCEKTPDSDHDFDKDPIKFVYDGEWLTADRTTLGADNGIAIAMAMALAVDTETNHPPLELLFTVDEETGLTGANALEPGFVQGKILINIDSEDEGVFTVGCAGGINTNSDFPLDFSETPDNFKFAQLKAAGMKGGHSGIDIDKEKANAIKILSLTLKEIINKKIDLRLANIQGGSAHNAIPRDAHADICFPEASFELVQSIVSECNATFNQEYKTTDPDLNLSLSAGNGPGKSLSPEETDKAVNILLVFPHGVAAMSPEIKDLVETSNNLASVKIENESLLILSSQRSSAVSRLKSHTQKIKSLASLAGGNAQSGDGYPPWQPNMDSPLLKRSLTLYEKMYNKKPVVEVIHAGLECGIIGDKNPGMDMISIGPTLKYPHSPDEKIHVGTIGMVWDFVAELLKEIK